MPGEGCASSKLTPGSTQVSRVIYGAIIGLALVVALEHHPPRAAVMVGTLLATALPRSAPVGASRARVGEIAADLGAVAFGIGFAAVFFVLSAAGAGEVETAFAVAKWSGLGLIGVDGFSAARLAGADCQRRSSRPPRSP